MIPPYAKFRILLGVLFLCLNLTFPNFLLAESLEIYGLKFEIDEIVKIDDRSSKITLLGDTRIVAPEDVPIHVLKAYFALPDFLSRFNQSGIEEFIRLAMSDGSSQWAAAMLNRILENNQYSLEDRRHLVFSFGSSPNELDMFRELLLYPTTPVAGQLRAIPFLRTAAKDLKWIKESLPRSQYPSLADVIMATTWLIEERAVLGMNGEEVDLLQAAGVVYGSSSEELTKIASAVTKINQLISMPVTLDKDKIYPYLFNDPEKLDSRLIRPFAVKKIHEFAKYAVSNQASTKALSLLSEVLPQERSELTHQIIIEALNSLKSDRSSLNINVAVRQLLSTESKNSEAVKLAYSEFLIKSFNQMISSGSLRSAGKVRQEYKTLGLGADSLYDELLFKEALAWLSKDNRSMSETILSLKSKQLTIFQSFQLILSGRYGSPINFILILSVPLLIILFLAMRIKGQKIRVSETKFKQAFSDNFEHNNSEYEQSEDSYDFNRGHFTALRGRQSPELREYRELMVQMELPPGAGLKDIKKAYRSLIKKVHPDAQNQGAVETSEEFIVLSRVYERILELRKIMGLPEG